MSAKHLKKRETRTLYTAGFILGILMLFGMIVASVSAAVMNVLPLKLLLPIIAAALIVSVIIAVFLFRSRSGKVCRCVCIVLAVLLTVLSAFASYYCIATTHFFNVNADATSDTLEYSVIAKKGSGITLTQDKVLTTGLWNGDIYSEQAKSELEKLTESEYYDYDSFQDLIYDVEGVAAPVDSSVPQSTASGIAPVKDVALSIGVMQTAFLDNVETVDDTLMERIEVLATFTIKVKQPDQDNDNEDEGEVVDADAPFIVYISGIDTYGKLASVSRSDVNMLMAINPKTHKVLLLNTPRDTLVQLHGTTGLKDKLTHAGNFGVNMSIQTLEDFYDIKIDKYVRINFTSFIKIIDALGGVDVDSAYAFTDKGESYVKGMNHLNGKRALAFSRARHPFAAGDFVRGENQQRVIEAVIKKLTSPSVLTKYTSLLNSLKNKLQTDMGTAEIKNLINNQLDNNSSWDIERYGLIGKGSKQLTHSISRLKSYVMVADEESLKIAKEKIAEIMLDGSEETNVSGSAISGSAVSPPAVSGTTP